MNEKRAAKRWQTALAMCKLAIRIQHLPDNVRRSRFIEFIEYSHSTECAAVNCCKQQQNVYLQRPETYSLVVNLDIYQTFKFTNTNTQAFYRELAHPDKQPHLLLVADYDCLCVFCVQFSFVTFFVEMNRKRKKIHLYIYKYTWFESLC